MLHRFAHRLLGLAILAALTFALVATAYAHRVPTTRDARIEAYVLAGGMLADLCGDADGDGRADHNDCPACQITGSAAPPQPVTVVADAGFHLLARIVMPRESLALRPVRDPARGLRAPPFV